MPLQYTRSGRFLSGAARGIGKVHRVFSRGQQVARGVSSLAAGLQDIRGYANPDPNGSNVLETIADFAGKVSDTSAEVSDAADRVKPNLEDLAYTYGTEQVYFPEPRRQHSHGTGYCNRSIDGNLCREERDHVHVDTDHGMRTRRTGGY